MKENKIERIFLIVLDSVGCGELPDAASFGDEGSNTLRSISRSKAFSAENMKKLGLANVDGVDFLGECTEPIGAYARLGERSPGKDTTIGHWEIAGVVSDRALPTYPDGFPSEVLEEFERLTGRGVLCNKPYSGTEVIKDYGREHMESGRLIVYTSADSVFQIAAHEDIVPVAKLYEYCEAARGMLVGKHGVGRVIARPFTGEYPNFKRTANRHDYSLQPPRATMLDAISESGLEVRGIGKISDIFAGKGITSSVRTRSNLDGLEKTLEMMGEDFRGLCFVNLVDFDSAYGHRNDVDGYASAYAEFDGFLPKLLRELRKGDVIMITADHGCDPATESTDHSREYVPFVAFGDAVKPVSLGTRGSFADIGATVCELLGVGFRGDGESFADRIIK